MEFVDVMGMKGFLMRTLRKVDEPRWQKWHDGLVDDATTFRGIGKLTEDVFESVASYSVQKEGEIERLRNRLETLSRGAYGLGKSET